MTGQGRFRNGKCELEAGDTDGIIEAEYTGIDHGRLSKTGMTFWLYELTNVTLTHTLT